MNIFDIITNVFAVVVGLSIYDAFKEFSYMRKTKKKYEYLLRSKKEAEDNISSGKNVEENKTYLKIAQESLTQFYKDEEFKDKIRDCR